VIVRFVDIGEVVDHHCLNFSFIIIRHDHEGPLNQRPNSQSWC